MTGQPHVLEARHLAYSYRPEEPVLRDQIGRASCRERV